MSKLRRIPAIALTLVLIVQLLPISAFASRATLYGMPKQVFYVEMSASETAYGLSLTAEVVSPWEMSEDDFASLLEANQPVLETWSYVGDSLVFETHSYKYRVIKFRDNIPYIVYTVELEDTDNVYAEMTWASGTQSEDYELNMNGWTPTRFADVSRGNWYFSYVDYAANVLGLINGKGDSGYSPDANMTYAEAIVLAARMHSRFLRLNYVFQPIDGKPWYQPYLDYAAKYDIPYQYIDYNAAITRAEYVHIFFAAFPEISGFPDDLYYEAINDITDGSIPDVPAGYSYADEIYALYRAGIITGSDSAHSFKPNDSIKRSEVATIVCRMCDYGRQRFSLG